jgi:Zn-dependent M28 family amino/carboxypeptidase
VALAALVLAAAPACGGERGTVMTGFDGARAMAHVRKLVELGPRPAGSPALDRARAYLADELRGYGLTVREDRFTARTPVGDLPMANLVAERAGQRPEVIALAGHIDTKRLAGFVGANDSGSSTGVLLEAARVLAAGPPPPHTLWFVFFDGEEAVQEWTPTDSLYGSRHMVESLRAQGTLARLRALVLLDMVGDRDLAIPRELNSTPWLLEAVREAAVRTGHARHFPDRVHAITDDHSPFLAAGVAAVDLIDFNYGSDARNPGPGGPANAWWHTEADTLDKVAPESLQVVGEVVLAALPAISAGLTPPAAPAR